MEVWSRQFKWKNLKLKLIHLILLSLVSLFKDPRHSKLKEEIMFKKIQILIKNTGIMLKLNRWHCRNNKDYKGLIKVIKEVKKRVYH